MPAKPSCLTPNCGRPGGLRGLCRHCYDNASGAIRAGKTTWEELVRLGLSADPAKRGSRRTSIFTLALEKARRRANGRATGEEGRGGHAQAQQGEEEGPADQPANR